MADIALKKLGCKVLVTLELLCGLDGSVLEVAERGRCNLNAGVGFGG